MNLFKLNNIYKIDTTLPKTKAPSRWLANKGKAFADKLDTHGYTTLEVVKAYADWLGVDPSPAISGVNSDPVNLSLLLQNCKVTDKEGKLLSDELLNHELNTVAPVLPEEIIDQLPSVKWLEVYKLTQGNFNYNLDIRILLEVKRICSDEWHIMNKDRIAKQAQETRTNNELRLDKEWQEQVDKGNITISKAREGLSRRENMVLDFLVSPEMGPLPTDLVPFHSAKVKSILTTITDEIERRRKEKEEAEAAKLAKQIFMCSYRAEQELGCVLRNYGIKGILLGHIDSLLSMAPSSWETRHSLGLRVDVNQSYRLMLDLLDVVGSLEELKEALNYTGDFASDPFLTVDKPNNRYDWIVNLSAYILTRDAYNKNVKDVQAIVELAIGALSDETKFKSDVSHIKALVEESGNFLRYRGVNVGGEHEVVCDYIDGHKHYFSRNTKDIIKTLQGWMHEHKVDWAKEADRKRQVELELNNKHHNRR